MKQCVADVAVRELGSAESLLPAFEWLRTKPYPWWLDSALSGGERGRFSFAGADPYLVCRTHGRQLECEVRRVVRHDLVQESCKSEIGAGDPFEVLRWVRPSCLAATDSELSKFPFLGGAVGYLSYELARYLEALALPVDPKADFPELCLLFVDRVLILDHHEQKLWVSALGFGETASEARRSAQGSVEGFAAEYATSVVAAECSARLTPKSDALPPSEKTHGACAAAWYAKQVMRIKDHIAVGDLYQACLTHSIVVSSEDDPWVLYQRLREKNPAPFAAFLQLPEGSILCSSPERFLRLDEARFVESRPIKGTRPRGRSSAEDAFLCDSLQASPKDRAENLMIADLVRNDLGRVCEIGSVEAKELMAVEAYASVFQMVSTLRGRLREDCDAVDLIRAAFPPGSMTGAPKIAAMRLLAELEAKPRGVYSGALGYFDLRGGLDLAVVIRTILLAQGEARVQVGGGIVADSVPSEEYRESLDKARALLDVLGFEP